jgi:hypothetical protein
MIAPKCDKCQAQLNEFGGLAFSPPDTENKATKYHLCIACFELLRLWMSERPKETSDSDTQ